MNKNNYHTHTTRCFHAIGKDEEYVKAAIQANIKELGFSDHTPWHYDSSFKASMRMPECQLDDYIESILSLKEKYNGKKIKIDVNVEAIQPNEDALTKKWTGINEKIKDKYVEILSK